jgi:hypothetical protein
MFFSFFADDEPIAIIFHVSSTRKKQDYRWEFDRIITFILIDIYCNNNSL